MTTRVLIVDDHPVFRDGLAALVSSLPDMEVSALASDGAEALKLVRSRPIDVVLMDLNMPIMSGVDATTSICAMPDPPKVLVLTMVDDDDTVVAAMRAGARGYVLKGAAGDEIATAIRTVAAGGAVFGAGVAAHVLALSSSPRPTEVSDASGLTEREREVLEQLATGSSNAQIARSLGLSLKTVQNYVSKILDKLQVADRTQAALHAQRQQNQ
jgi:DNA-binding NarL/FixJ family response regulator